MHDLMSLAIDHLIVCVTDLHGSAALVESQLGLMAIEGGRHVGHGTANYLIPLGPNYIELVAVVNPAEAVNSVFGTWVDDKAIRSPFHLDGLAVRTNTLTTDAKRLDLSPVSMSRIRPDGYLLAWSLIGVDGMTGPENLPFLIQWEVPEDEFPGRADAGHHKTPGGIISVVLSGDPDKISALIPSVEGVTIKEGRPGITQAVLLVEGRRVSWIRH